MEKAKTGVVKEASAEKEFDINTEYVTNFTEAQRDDFVAISSEEFNTLDSE